MLVVTGREMYLRPYRSEFLSSAGNLVGNLFVKVFLYLIGLVVLPFVIWTHDKRVQKRRDSMRRHAENLRLQFSETPDRGLVNAYHFLNSMRNGIDRYALNVMRGAIEGRPIVVFDYHFKTDDGEWWWPPSRHKHLYHSFVVMELEKSFPELTIAAESSVIFSRLARALGRGDINFESHEFSRRYDVRSKDKKFAYDFCNAQMIEYLLDQPVIPIEIEQKSIAIGVSEFLRTDKIQWHLDHLLKIRKTMPDYLFS